MKDFYYLRDFPDYKRSGKQRIAVCPQCGKKHLAINPENGLFNCFYAGCGFHGKLRDFWEKRPSATIVHPHRTAHTAADTAPNNAFGMPAGGAADEGTDMAPMLPEDYASLPADVLERIVPFHPDPDTTDANLRAVQQYLADQGIGPLTAEAARVGVARYHFPAKEGKGGGKQPCLVYVNYVNGQPVNAKFRSVEPLPGGGYAKAFLQVSPTTPCAPYGIDCIHPLLTDGVPQRLIVTEGEKDCLALHEAGYTHVVSVPNGAAADLEKCFTPFADWLASIPCVVLCGDTDRAGRTLTRHLRHYFGHRSYLVDLPAHCKDIADVLRLHGVGSVRQVIEQAEPCVVDDIVDQRSATPHIIDIMQGHYDHGYSVGHGPHTDRVFHLTDCGGLIIVTGKPNAGKTDFLNDLCARLMAKRRRHVCFLSFEVPDKAKHTARMVQRILGATEATGMSAEELQPYVDFTVSHLTHLDMRRLSPTPQHILSLADAVRQRHPNLGFLVIDPYLFMELDTARGTTETQAIKRMLTLVQTWGRRHGIWVIIVAHPRKLQKRDGMGELEEIDMYTIGGSAAWANLADFIFTLQRVDRGSAEYTQLDMLKVRDQEQCRPGTVFYVRQRCGRYDERSTAEACMAEGDHDWGPWG